MSSINWNTAKDMINAYLDNPNRVAAPNNQTLKGISFKKSEVEELLNQSGQDIEEMMIFLAVREEDLSKPPEEQYFTNVLVGVNNQNEIVTALALEFADPCPPGCPDNLNDVL